MARLSGPVCSFIASRICLRVATAEASFARSRRDRLLAPPIHGPSKAQRKELFASRQREAAGAFLSFAAIARRMTGASCPARHPGGVGLFPRRVMLNKSLIYRCDSRSLRI